MEPILEKRMWPRHQLKIPISLKYSDAKTFHRTWHAGETYDVSVDGMRIVSSAVTDIQPEITLEILCFPPNQKVYSDINEPEPVSMSGVVIWRDIRSGMAGIRLNS